MVHFAPSKHEGVVVAKDKTAAVTGRDGLLGRSWWCSVVY